MWSIQKVKDVGREAFRKNYWRSVLMTVLLAFVAGSVSLNVGTNTNRTSRSGTFGGHGYGFSFSIGAAAGILAAAFFLILTVCVVAVLVQVFVINPIEVGARKFFFQNLRENPGVSLLGYGFDNNYRNVVRTLFLKQLYTFLWSLLFEIPGIVKYYEYMMIPYLLAENPRMTAEEAFYESKRMMDGEKWNAFVFDLSFIGWFILSALTGGILYIFYVGPYWHSARAALFDAIRIMKPKPIFQQGYNAYGQAGYTAPPQNSNFEATPHENADDAARDETVDTSDTNGLNENNETKDEGDGGIE